MRAWIEFVARLTTAALIAFILFTLLLLVGCGTASDPSTARFVVADRGWDATHSRELMAVVAQWEDVFRKAGAGLGRRDALRDVVWAEDLATNEAVGECVSTQLKNPWNGVSRMRYDIHVRPELRDGPLLYWVVGHELGHCLFGLEHAEGPNEVMSAYVQEPWYLHYHADEMTARFLAQIGGAAVPPQVTTGGY